MRFGVSVNKKYKQVWDAVDVRLRKTGAWHMVKTCGTLECFYSPSYRLQGKLRGNS
ncbi:unnamed protein product [Ixodes persulcatus]